jgi:hypothetical protein
MADTPTTMMFKYDWSRFDAKLGLIFMVGALVVFNLSSRFDFALYAAGISALLAWLTIVLVPGRRRSRHLLGLGVYLVVGVVLTWLADLVLSHGWLKLVTMGIVTFAGYMMLLRGAHAFMVAWCLVYWYLLAPLFLGEKGLGPVVLGHVVGVCLVLALNLLKPVWTRASGGSTAETDVTEVSDEERLPLGMVVRYSSIVSVSIVTGVAAGARWLTADPTLIANATLNVISPSLDQTWRNGLERVILGTLGIVGGFYFGWFFPGPWVGLLVTAVCSFLALALTRVSFGLLIGVFFFLLSYPWGAMHSDLRSPDRKREAHRGTGGCPRWGGRHRRARSTAAA